MAPAVTRLFLQRLFLRRLSVTLTALILSCLVSYVSAHATMVVGTLASEPTNPEPGTPFTLTLEMDDPTGFAVEDAYVLAEFRLEGRGDPFSTEFVEVEPGSYTADISLPDTGRYEITMRDKTFRQEEATAEFEVVLAQAPLFPEGSTSFIFPPTATGDQNSLRRWLIWVIALPVVVGIVVTVLVLRGSSEEAAA